MNSFGIFYDVNLKKSNDLMEVFDQALRKTNNLMETMDNFNSYKKRNDSNINESIKNNNSNTGFQIRKNNRQRTYNPKKSNKSQLKPIQNNQFYFRKREPYNYQKEYENELINQIEKLFNPVYKNNGNKEEEMGMLSFLSPLINSNIDEKNKKFYKKNINKVENEINTGNDDNNKDIEYENSESLNGYEGTLEKGINTKYAKSNRKFNITRKNNFSNKGYGNSKMIQLPKMGNKITFYHKKYNKYNIPEINELKKNRYFSRTKTNFRSNIIDRDTSSKSKKTESNVDQLIPKLKKHYSCNNK